MQKELTILSLIYTHIVNTAISLHPYFKKNAFQKILNSFKTRKEWTLGNPEYQRKINSAMN